MWEPLKYGEDIEYPFYMHAIGFGMSLSSMLWIPGYAIYYVLSQRGSLRDVSILNAVAHSPFLAFVFEDMTPMSMNYLVFMCFLSFSGW